jgi:putative oxidoreductase
MNSGFNQRFRTTAHTALRIAAGAAFFSHGAQKLLGWFGGFGPDGGTAELLTWIGAAGAIELVAGFLIVIGLFTRPAAFVASGEMAVAYCWRHWALSGEMWWWDNRGELALVYSFLWLLFAAWGAGAFSLDAWLRRRRERAAPSFEDAARA